MPNEVAAKTVDRFVKEDAEAMFGKCRCPGGMGWHVIDPRCPVHTVAPVLQQPRPRLK